MTTEEVKLDGTAVEHFLDTRRPLNSLEAAFNSIIEHMKENSGTTSLTLRVVINNDFSEEEDEESDDETETKE